MKGDEISEAAKAVKESAKFGQEVVKLADNAGGFLSRIVGEPIDALSGIVG